jgi:hypothetical protein
MGVDIGVFYRYAWQGQPRAMYAQLLDDIVTITEADPVTCERTEPVGVFAWVDGAIVGTGLSDTRKTAIAAMIHAAIASGTL